VKFLSLMTFHDDLPSATARRLWAHHAPLALRVHVGMARYVRDWVEELSPAELPVPRFHGIAELHFPSVQAMTEHWFDSEAGRAAIVARCRPLPGPCHAALHHGARAEEVTA
jgi:hypothetical protein